MGFTTFQNSEYGGQPLMLFRFYSGSRTWLYTNLNSNVLRGSEVYTPLPISLGPIEQNAAEGPAGVSIALPTRDPLSNEFKNYLPPEPIEIDVFIRHRADPEGEYRTVFMGEVGSAQSGEDGMTTLTCYPITHKLSRVVPWPVYCSNCNYAVYSVGCGVDKELFKAEAEVSAISGDTVSAAAFAAEADHWFSSGYVVRVATNEVRWILIHIGDTLTLVAPFVGLQSGEALIAYAGCDGLELTCRDKFNNLPRHAGFPDTPKKNPFVDDIFGTGSSSSSSASAPVDPGRNFTWGQS